MYEFAIIGAGVVGGLIARELARYTPSIVLLERASDVAMGATRANSAIVHAGFDAKEGSLKARLNVEGSELMEGVCAELGVKYRRNGSLVVGFDEADEQTLRALLQRGERNGVRGLSLLSREQVRALEPSIGEGVSCALHAPTGAIVCPYELCLAAVGCAMDNGATLLTEYEVTAIARTAEGFSLTAADGRTVGARRVINCAGVFSDEVAAMLGPCDFTVHARRGEYMLLDKTAGALVSHTVFRCPSPMGKGVLVSPTVDGNLLLGPTAVDIDDKHDVRTTAEGLADVRRMAAEQVRGLPFGSVITSFTGLRSVGSTGDFVIRRAQAGFINVAAIESPGLSSSPAIARYVAELVREDGFSAEVRRDFCPTRPPMHAFREMSEDEQNEVIARDPSYARVVCRCELVTEGEILAAIRTNPRPRDLDGVKRRTRATMGRCQGGFCTPHVVELLARELGIPYGEVTKCGAGSRINLYRTKEG